MPPGRSPRVDRVKSAAFARAQALRRRLQPRTKRNDIYALDTFPAQGHPAARRAGQQP
jgi:hypothetical protein